MINKLKVQYPEYICYNNDNRPYFAFFAKIDSTEDVYVNHKMINVRFVDE